MMLSLLQKNSILDQIELRKRREKKNRAFRRLIAGRSKFCRTMRREENEEEEEEEKEEEKGERERERERKREAVGRVRGLGHSPPTRDFTGSTRRIHDNVVTVK
jgi:hypothetical protein